MATYLLAYNRFMASRFCCKFKKVGELMADIIKKNIVLIGFMGVGKSIVGRNLAALLEYDFFDIDAAIEEATGLPLRDVVRRYGNLRWVSEEHLAVEKSLLVQPRVIATGINTLQNEKNCRLLKENGYVVLLEASPNLIFERIIRKGNRYFLPPKATEKMVAKMLKDYKETYRNQADLIIWVENQKVEDVAKEIQQEYAKANGINY